MKKCVVVIMIISTIIGCNKKETGNSSTVETDEKVTSSELDCLTLDNYYVLTIEEKIEWLRLKGDSVCKDIMEKAVLEGHKVTGTLQNQKEEYTIKWGDLKKIIGSHGYDAYLSVQYTTDTKIDSLKMVSKYVDGRYCFSTALINNLAKVYAKDDNTEFKFSFANVDNQSAVVIQVDGKAFYDYSTDPMTAPVVNIPL